jgi:hypothetical protein
MIYSDEKYTEENIKIYTPKSPTEPVYTMTDSGEMKIYSGKSESINVSESVPPPKI